MRVTKQYSPLILLIACTISESVYGTLAVVEPFKESNWAVLSFTRYFFVQLQNESWPMLYNFWV